jgi:phosphoglycolate phosphatase
MTHSTVIFDFDGTLLYTVQDLANAVNHAISKHGYPRHGVDAIQAMVGNGVNKLVARSLPRGFDTPDYEEIMADFRAYYSQHCFDNTRAYDGVQEMLQTLKARGCKMAIVTNKYQVAAEELRKRFFADTIDLIVGDLEGRQRKPAPDSVLLALEKLGSTPEESVYVGDTEVDMYTAQNAGMDFVCVAWGYRSAQQIAEINPPAVAHSPMELAELV